MSHINDDPNRQWSRLRRHASTNWKQTPRTYKDVFSSVSESLKSPRRLDNVRTCQAQGTPKKKVSMSTSSMLWQAPYIWNRGVRMLWQGFFAKVPLLCNEIQVRKIARHLNGVSCPLMDAHSDSDELRLWPPSPSLSSSSCFVILSGPKEEVKEGRSDGRKKWRKEEVKEGGKGR